MDPKTLSLLYFILFVTALLAVPLAALAWSALQRLRELQRRAVAAETEALELRRAVVHSAYVVRALNRQQELLNRDLPGVQS